MADATLGTVLRHLRRLGAPRRAVEVSDRQLLDDFLRAHDEAAFTALLSRHGPMVLGVCRRVLRHSQDADDAFQATFLVLVRRAGAIRRLDSLASWLYGVALRTARRARLDAVRRRLREERSAAPAVGGPPDEPDWRDLRAVIDEEIDSLPEKYRAPLVLCHLQGQTNAQAAQRLRVPLGSLSKRLARARGLLRGRLLRRGIALSAGALATVLAGQVSAVPPLLARAATGTALLALAGGAVPAPVAVLAGGVTRALATGPLKAWLLGLAALGLVLGGGMFVASQRGAPSPPAEAPAARGPAVPPEKDAPAEVPPRREHKDLDTIRQRLLLRGGGNAKSEAAVAAGLVWITKQQAADGHWSLDGGGMKNDIAGTAFGLLPLLGAGHTHQDDKGPFAKNVARGLEFLVAQQGKGGDFGGGMYPQALASRALFQAYALTGDPKLAAPARAALDYLLKAQNAAGGWGYTPASPRGDLSVTAGQLVALFDARAAGLDVPQAAMDSAARFVRSCRAGEGYSYLPGAGTASRTMTAAGLRSLSDLGEGANADAVRWLAQADVAAVSDAYGTLWVAEVQHRHGGDGWEKWNARLRDLLVSRQGADGGWPTTGDVFGSSGGRLMVSSLTVLTLEVYYREELPFVSAVSRSLKESETRAAWSDLAADDPVKARRAVWALAGAPKQGVPLIDEALGPARPPALDEKQVRRLIAELDDDDFEVREKASAALAKLGSAAAPALRAALKTTTSAEPRRRLEALLTKLDEDHRTAEHRRALRAVEVLEHVGAPEARQVLKRLAKESGDSEVVRAAGAALKRLGDAPASQP
jgi:RNA polymerase sigma factor (sigma-70 family)